MNLRTIFCFGCALLLMSCSTTKITDSYTVREPFEHFDHVVVLALVPEKHGELRERIETAMADDLCQIGYFTISALDAYGQDAFCGMCKQEILEKLKRDDISAVITVSFVARTEQRQYVSKVIPRLQSLGFYDYQMEAAESMQEQGYISSGISYYWETNLYRLRGQKLLYSARTETIDPKSAEAFAREYGRLVIQDMVAKGVLEKPKTPNPFFD